MTMITGRLLRNTVFSSSVLYSAAQFTDVETKKKFTLHNHKYIITKKLLDNTGGWPEGSIPINAGHPLLHTKQHYYIIKEKVKKGEQSLVNS